MTENYKLRKAILSAFYNILQRNFRILLILWCSFKLWWNFCLDLLSSKCWLISGEWSIIMVGVLTYKYIVYRVEDLYFRHFVKCTLSINASSLAWEPRSHQRGYKTKKYVWRNYRKGVLHHFINYNIIPQIQIVQSGSLVCATWAWN
jgi:hypothetical protein